MQPQFPTKKFFVVLLFIVLVAVGAFKLFGFLNSRSAQKDYEAQKLSITQKELLPLQENRGVNPVAVERSVATSTLTAVAAVVYLNEQTKANGATMGEITAKVGKQIQDAKDKLDADTYTKSDIIIGSDNSPEALKKYANDMMGIFTKDRNQGVWESYLTIIKRALETKDPKEVKKLDTYINFYTAIVKESRALSVPSSAASIHLRIINSYAEMLLLIKGFQTSFDDLPVAIASNSRIQKASTRFMDSFKEAADFFNEKGVTFLSTEKGRLFGVITQDYIKR